MPGDITKRVILQLSAKDDGVSDTMTKAASGTKSFGGSVGELNSQLTSLRGTMGGLAQQFGAGAWGNLLAAGSLAGATLAVGAIMAQAMRMAYVFEETSARVAANLSITGGGAGFSGAYRAVQAASLSGVPMQYGYSHTQALGAMAAYQAAAGADRAGTIGALRPGLSFARATGMAPEEATAAIGTVTRITQEDASRASRSLYGGAGEAGQLGRDIRGFIATTTTVLTNLAMAAPGSPMSAGRAAQMVADISRVGGIYSTPGMVQTVAGGLMSLTQGNQADPTRLAISLAAGMSRRDIILGEGTPQNQARMAQTIARMGGGWHSLQTDALMVQMMGQTQARALLDMPDAARNKLLTDMRAGRAAPLGDTDKTAAQVMNTGFGTVAREVANLDNAMTKMGREQLDYWSKFLGNNPKLLAGADAAINWLPKIFAGIIGLDIVMGVGKLGGGLIRGLLGAGAGAEATAAVAGAAGVPAAVIGAGIAVSGATMIGTSIAGYNIAKWMHSGVDPLWAKMLSAGGSSIDALKDYASGYTGAGFAGGGGILPQFRAVVNALAAHGEQFGVYDFNKGHTSLGMASPHSQGRAMDVDYIGGRPVGDVLTDGIRHFIQDALSTSPNVRVGVPSGIFAQTGSDGGRIFPDTPGHVHVELDNVSAGTTHRTTKKITSKGGATHTVVATTHIQVTPSPTPTTSSSRTTGLGASGRW